MEISLKGHYAGVVSRLIAYIIDLVVISVVVVGTTWFVNTVQATLGLRSLINDNATRFVLGGLAVLLLAGIYFVFFWTLTGQTPGKMIMGVRVVTLDGEPLSLGRSIRRAFGYLVSALIFYLGFIWILIDNRRQGWHDKLAGTCVIYNWDARPGSRLQDEMERRRASGQESS
jgi:uncharacterized RDD family membrane protein YckC